ncbi:glycosyltransferase [Myroides sp. TSA_177.3]|uniref:glycosyltransferase n=1 Tax=Myroides sp. TSA_177.3 TaxID=3415650 RepID=UPI0040461CF8
MSINKVLLVNNTIFYRDNDELFLNKETGVFFEKIVESGYDVSLFQISQDKLKNDSFANFSLNKNKFKIYEVKRERSRRSKIISFFKAFFILQKAILKNDFVYIFYPGPICTVIAILCVLYKKPFGLYVRGEQRINSSISKFIIKKASIVLTISQLFTDKISNINSNVSTIRPMIGFSELDIIVEKNFSNYVSLRLLYVGRIVFDKGVFELVDAVQNLRQKGYNISLSFVGDGPDNKALKKKVSDFQLDDSVSFLGMISDKEELKYIYYEHDVFVLPTYHEGFPRVLYEAMIMHLGIVTTFVGTIDYLMVHNDNCLRIEVRSIDSIVNEVKKLYEDRILLKNIALKGNRTISKYLDGKKSSHAEQLNEFIKKYES